MSFFSSHDTPTSLFPMNAFESTATTACAGSRTQTLLSALFILLSITTFVLFEVWKAFHQSKDLLLYERSFTDPKNQTSIARLQEAADEFRKQIADRGRTAAIVWWVTFPLTVFTGLLAAIVLLWAFVGGLLWPPFELQM